MTMDPALAGAAREWMDDDPDPHTRAEMKKLLEEGAAADLQERVGSRLEFGTAGIRGVLGAGPGRMNRALVRKVTAGLAAYLIETLPQVTTRGVVVGRDGRHLSREFAEDAAAVLAGAGIPVHWISDLAPTPVCAFAVTRLRAAAGVMITASHNPPEYNGYKVYWENGAQIIPPHDAGISRAVDAVTRVRDLPLTDAAAARAAGLWHEVGPEVIEAYYQGALALRRQTPPPAKLSVVYTPMHGVGGVWVEELLRRAGYANFHPVSEQFQPDGDFPTVRFPNPEEPGAMDLALATARAQSADLVLANDPDADRLAVLVPQADGYRALTGNEIGTLLAHYLLTQHPPAGSKSVMTTIVSSRALAALAERFHVRYEETLTGFKWIANRAMEVSEASGETFVFGFEEALGYTVGELVRDKDGVSAALLFTEMAAWVASRGSHVLGYLEDIYRDIGLFHSAQHSVTLPGSEGARRIAEVMTTFRNNPPSMLGGQPVVGAGDLETGTWTAGGTTSRLEFPPSNVLVYALGDGSRVLLRPSGTEPKIKFYFEVREAMTAADDLETARRRAAFRLDAIQRAFLHDAGMGEPA